MSTPAESSEGRNARLLAERRAAEQAARDELRAATERLKGPLPAEAFVPAPGSESAKLPPSVFRQVRSAVLAHQLYERGAEQARLTDRVFGGGGRYESEYFQNHRAPAQAAATLATFRELAPDNDVDAEKVIAELGGVPDSRPSERALSWQA